MTCRCGLALYRHLGHERCTGCSKAQAWCRCVPQLAEPEWRRWTREHQSAKDLTGAAA